MPHARSLARGEALEEERRLCYVGMTRARERLHLTWAQSRSVFGQRRLSEPSRFLGPVAILLERSKGPAWQIGPEPSLAVLGISLEELAGVALRVERHDRAR